MILNENVKKFYDSHKKKEKNTKPLSLIAVETYTHPH